MRAAIFIDGGYFLQQLKNAKHTPNYEKISDHLLATIRKAAPVDLLRCYFYYCAPWMPQNPSEEALRRMENHKTFVNELESLSRWQVRLGKLEKRWDGQKEYFEQKRVDVLLSIDMVRHATAGHIHHAILIAGDSDFIPAVQAAKESGVVVSLWCGGTNTVHKDLVTLVDEVHNLDWSSFPKQLDAASRSEAQPRPQETPAPENRQQPSRQQQNQRPMQQKRAPNTPAVSAPELNQTNARPKSGSRRPRKPGTTPQR